MRRRERVPLAPAMYEGRARGGPRAGVKLSAGPLWDGTIARTGVDGKRLDGKYPGRYVWDGMEEEWIWHARKQPEPERGRPATGKHRRVL